MVKKLIVFGAILVSSVFGYLYFDSMAKTKDIVSETRISNDGRVNTIGLSDGSFVPITNLVLGADDDTVDVVQSIIDYDRNSLSVAWGTPFDFSDERSDYLLAHNPGLFESIYKQFENGDMSIELTDRNGVRKTMTFEYQETVPKGESMSYELNQALVNPDECPHKVHIQFCIDDVNTIYSATWS